MSAIQNRLAHIVSRAGLRQLSRVLMLGFGFSTAVAAQTGTPTVSVGNASVVEGDSGTRSLSIPLTRTGSVTEGIAVQYQTNASPTNPATAGTDYVSVTSGSAVLPQGLSGIFLPVTVNGDVNQEPDENFLLHIISATNVGPTPAFGTATTLAGGSLPQAVVSADFNGDGLADLAIANQSGSGGGGISFLFGQAARGTFAAAGFIATTAQINELVASDLNRDGRPDLALSTFSGSVPVLTNATPLNGTVAVFTASDTIGVFGRGIAVGDFNNDGWPDLVKTASNSDFIFIERNTTAPGQGASFNELSPGLSVGDAPTLPVTGDFNGDGRIDIAVHNTAGNSVSVLLNTTTAGVGTPSFAAPLNLPTAGFLGEVATADINGDGRLDLVTGGGTTLSVLLNTTPAGSSAASFASAVSVNGGLNTRGVRLADVNGDGRPDLLATDGDFNQVRIFLNLTVPGASVPVFAPPALRTTGGTASLDLAVQDFNGDGLPDVVTANQNSNNVSVLLNATVPPAPAPAFGSAVLAATGLGPFDIVEADFNLDGRPDLATANSNGSSVSVLLNSTAPGAASSSFAPAMNLPSGSGPIDVTSGDLNLDGRPDLVNVNNGSSTFTVRLNTTVPGASVAAFDTVTTLSTGSDIRGVALGDVNQDGKPDLAVSGSSGSLRVYINSTPPSPAAATFLPSPLLISGLVSPIEMEMADIDGDGLLDLAVASTATSPNRIYLMRNTTTPGATTASYAAPVQVPLNFPTNALRLADLNGDGRPDLAASSSGFPALVLLNTTVAGSGVLSFGSATELTTQLPAQGLALRDINGDGRLDLAVSSGVNSLGATVVYPNTTQPGASVASFGTAVQVGGTFNGTDVALADFNGDGRPDLAAADRAGNQVQVFTNQLYPVNIATNEATGTILDDDAPATISINDVTRAEGNSGNTAFAFTVSLSKPATSAVSLAYTTANGTATEGAAADYLLNAGAVNFSAGQTSQTITVQVVGDTVQEPDETFFVNLSNPTGATIADAQGLGTITNDDVDDITPDAFTFTDVANVAVNATQTSNTITVTGINVAAPFSVSGTGFASLDGGVCTLTSGTVRNNQTLRLCHVSAASFNTGVTTTLTIGANGVLAGVSDSFTSTTEAAPSVSITQTTDRITEGGSRFYSVELAQRAASRVTVVYNTQNGTATANQPNQANPDFRSAGGVLIFEPGETRQSFSVTTLTDNLVEPDETFTVQLGDARPTGVLIGQGTLTVTIADGNATALSINDVTANEGNSGYTDFNFTVSVSSPSTSFVRVNYATANGTATTADNDYGLATGTVEFSPGETSKTLTIQVYGDNKQEPNESFTVLLSNPDGATISDGSGLGTITNDDVSTLSINDVTQDEGNSGTTAFSFTVSLTNPSASTVTANFATANGTATTADGDYTAVSGTLSFAPGETVKTVTVPVTGDLKVEPVETFTLQLSSPDGATIGDASGLGTIANDDEAFLSIDDVTLNEGNSGTTAFNFTLSLSNPSATEVGVAYTTVDGTASLADNDYAISADQVTFSPGETSKTVTIEVLGDLTVEPDETFTVLLSNPSSATISDASGLGTILNDDLADTAPEAFQFVDVSDIERGSLQTSNAITVQGINVPASFTVYGGFASLNGGACTLTAGTVSQGQRLAVCHTAATGYSAVTSTTLTIGASAQSAGVSDTFSSTTVGAPGVQLSPVTLAFGSQRVGVASAARLVLLSNTGASALAISSIASNNAVFAVTENCPALLPAGESCQIDLVFTPTGSQGFTGSLSVVSDAASSPNLVALSGTGIAPLLQVGPNASFGARLVNTTSAPQSLRLDNLGTDTLTFTSITVNGDYIRTGGTCGSTLAAASNCSVTVTFTPTAPGTRNGSVAVVSDGGPGSIDLFGSGVAVDSSPDAFLFTDAGNVAAGSLQTSNPVTVGGINVGVPFTVTGGFASVNGSACNQVGGSVVATDVLTVCHTAAAGFGVQTDTTLTVGGVSDTFTSTTAAAPVIDVTPDAFGFASEALISPNSRRTSKAIVITGYAAPTTIRVSAGSFYSIGCKEANITAAPGMISPGQSVCVRHTSSPDLGKTVTTTLTVGGVDGTYSTTTNPPDTRPNNFSFPTTTGVAVNSVNTSSPITVGGINTASPISVSAGSFYSIGNGPFVDTPGTVVNGDAVRVRTTASNRRNISVVATLTIGGVNGLYRVTTAK